MEQIALTSQNISSVVQKTAVVLRQGGLVVFPSDTVYGLAVDATNPSAVTKLLQFKERQKGKAISIAVDSLDRIATYVSVSPTQKRLLATILPGPFTIILPSHHLVDRRLEAEDGSLGVRYTLSKFMTMLAEVCETPFTATSANISGSHAHHSLDALMHSLSAKKQAMIDLCIDEGILPPNKPSTVINLSEPTYTPIRSGQMQFTLLTKVISNSVTDTKKVAEKFLSSIAQKANTLPILIFLSGELGAGKTVFAKGIGEYLQTETVDSPTFTMYSEYATKHPIIQTFHHLDLYRLESISDISVLNFTSFILPHSLTCIEWAERLGSTQSVTKDKAVDKFLVDIQEKDTHKREINIYSISINP